MLRVFKASGEEALAEQLDDFVETTGKVAGLLLAS